MSIKSHAFGRVTLTGSDARKFENQVRCGKPIALSVNSPTRIEAGLLTQAQVSARPAGLRGVAGNSAAYSLSASGCRVFLIEVDDPYPTAIAT